MFLLDKTEIEYYRYCYKRRNDKGSIPTNGNSPNPPNESNLNGIDAVISVESLSKFDKTIIVTTNEGIEQGYKKNRQRSLRRIAC